MASKETAGGLITAADGDPRQATGNLPDAHSRVRLSRAMVDLHCESFKQASQRIMLDIDDTFDAVHGGQQLRLFNAHYDEYGFQPIIVFDGAGYFIIAVLRPAKRRGGKEIRAFLHRLLRAICANWPKPKSCCAATVQPRPVNPKTLPPPNLARRRR